jgi:hypothetical protein
MPLRKAPNHNCKLSYVYLSGRLSDNHNEMADVCAKPINRRYFGNEAKSASMQNAKIAFRVVENTNYLHGYDLTGGETYRMKVG